MKVIRQAEQTARAGTTFTGPAQVTPLLPAQPDSGLRVTLVSFEDGAVTYWHEHPGEQILYILSGEGRVGNGQEEIRVSAGDVVHAGPGEKHWHGAAPGRSMSHLSVTTVGPPIWYDEAPE
ncbi:MAG TPA: cupin domain-containing protein [Anaerolineae bacterium]|nr:cupin domain-containing protein [Anaerolineae bacterium]